MPHADPEARRSYQRARYAADAERICAVKRARDERNREATRARKRAWAEANPQKRLEYGRRMNAKRKAIVDAAKASGCADCGEKDPIVIQFHHPNGRNGGQTIGDGARWGMQALIAEIAKCVPLCANCHIRRHKCV